MKFPARTRFIAAASVVVAAVAGLIGWSLTSSTSYYKTPGELAAEPTPQNQTIRVAGKVVDASIIRDAAVTTFDVTDGKATLSVTTEDVLPDTFGAGVEVVAEGAITEPMVLTASSVLTKCPSKFEARVNAAAGAAPVPPAAASLG